MGGDKLIMGWKDLVDCPRCAGSGFGDLYPGCLCGSCWDYCDFCGHTGDAITPERATVTPMARKLYIKHVWDHHCPDNWADYIERHDPDDEAARIQCRCFKDDE